MFNHKDSKDTELASFTEESKIESKKPKMIPLIEVLQRSYDEHSFQCSILKTLTTKIEDAKTYQDLLICFEDARQQVGRKPSEDKNLLEIFTETLKDLSEEYKNFQTTQKKPAGNQRRS